MSAVGMWALWLILAGLVLALGIWLVLGDSDSLEPVLSDLQLDPQNAQLTWTLDTDGATLTEFEVLVMPGELRKLTYAPRLDLNNELHATTSYTITVTARFDDADDVSTELITNTGTPTELSISDDAVGSRPLSRPPASDIQAFLESASGRLAFTERRNPNP
jgi:hypothetical protein